MVGDGMILAILDPAELAIVMAAAITVPHLLLTLAKVITSWKTR